MNIVFMGTPDFAVPSLRALAECGKYTVKAVYTQPDKPVGRKMILTAPPAKVKAAENGIEVWQPTSLRTDEAISRMLESLKQREELLGRKEETLQQKEETL